MKRVALLLLLVVALSSGATSALAFEVSGTDSVRLQLRPTLKQSLGLPGLSLSRLRLDLEAEWSERWVWEMAYEHQVLSRFAGSTTGLALQASQSASPYRFNAPWRPVMEWGADLLWRHQVDRAVLAYHGDTFDIRVGRQAIGLGRGTLFGAVDVFAPFSPLSVDREWRPGVDAVHLDWRASDTVSVDIMAAAAEGFEDGVVLARVRGYSGEFDASLLGGYRAGDWLVAVLGSAALGESSVYAEVAGYATGGESLVHGVFGSDSWTVKSVVGVSHMWPVAAGLSGTLEYFFNGFGLSDLETQAAVLLEPGMQDRFARGDLQSVGRHQLGATLSLLTEAEVQLGVGLTQSLMDGSGVVVPSIVWVVSDAVTLTALGSLPWGRSEATSGALRSEYGSMPRSALIQFAVYE